jgi:hypothetical protein
MTMANTKASDARRKNVSRKSKDLARFVAYPRGEDEPGLKYVSKANRLTLAHIHHLYGIETRVARKLGVHRNSVSKVVRGLLKSARISAALGAEISRINQKLLSGNGVRAQETRSHQASCGSNGQASQPGPERHAVSPSSSKPRIVLRCFLACNNGDVYANDGEGSALVTKIGRDQELEKASPPSRFIYPHGPLLPIGVTRAREATA